MWFDKTIDVPKMEFTPFNKRQKDEVEEVLEMYLFLRGTHSKEFDNDLLDFLDKIIKRNKK